MRIGNYRGIEKSPNYHRMNETIIRDTTWLGKIEISTEPNRIDLFSLV